MADIPCCSLSLWFSSIPAGGFSVRLTDTLLAGFSGLSLPRPEVGVPRLPVPAVAPAPRLAHPRCSGRLPVCPSQPRSPALWPLPRRCGPAVAQGGLEDFSTRGWAAPAPFPVRSEGGVCGGVLLFKFFFGHYLPSLGYPLEFLISL